MKASLRVQLHCASVAALIAGSVWAMPAAAQDSESDPQAAKPAASVKATDPDEATDTSETPEHDIVVTGTNISGVKAVGSETVTLNREAIIATGQTTPADVIRTLPQVRNLGEYREGGTQGGNNNQQGNAINLRGLGAAATLVLVKPLLWRLRDRFISDGKPTRPSPSSGGKYVPPPSGRASGVRNSDSGQPPVCGDPTASKYICSAVI